VTYFKVLAQALTQQTAKNQGKP